MPIKQTNKVLTEAMDRQQSGTKSAATLAGDKHTQAQASYQTTRN